MYNNPSGKPITPDFDPNSRITHPSDRIVVGQHTLVIDSRQRDFTLYPNPSFYRIPLGDEYKNITSIELNGAIIPKTSYNVHSTNNYIDFSIGSSITSIKLINIGYGYTAAPSVSIEPPKLIGGIQATAVAIVNLTTGSLDSINITNPGSGYYTSSPPAIIIGPPQNNNSKISGATAVALIGTLYTAQLRIGQYTIGGNPTLPGTNGTDLINEIQNAMNYAVNGGAYNPTSSSPFEVRIVSQYPSLTATAGTPESSNTNACLFNRIQITNVNSDHWELLYASGQNAKKSAAMIMGYNRLDYLPTATNVVIVGANVLINAGTTIRASNDYNLLDDPQYVILSFWAGDQAFERIESANTSLNKKFGTMIFDAVYDNVITDTEGITGVDNSGVTQLNGPITKGGFWSPPGALKALRGLEFDNKKLDLSAAYGKLTSLTIRFTKFSAFNDSQPEYYDFLGRDHLLIFTVRASDNQAGYKS